MPRHFHLLGAMVPSNLPAAQDSNDELSRWLDSHPSVIYVGLGTLVRLSHVQIKALRGCLKSPSSEDYRDGMPESINSGKCYETDLSEAAWRLIEPMLPAPRPGGRPRTTDLRAVLNAIFYLLRTGCQWRLLPREFPAWSRSLSLFPELEHRRCAE